MYNKLLVFQLYVFNAGFVPNSVVRAKIGYNAVDQVLEQIMQNQNNMRSLSTQLDCIGIYMVYSFFNAASQECYEQCDSNKG